MLIVLGAAHPLAGKPKPADYTYDQADETITATRLGNPEFYDADIVAGDAGHWMTWLEFVPGVGDCIWFGCRTGDTWLFKSRTTHGVGNKFARPTLTLDTAGTLWLSYEAQRGGQWDVFLMQHQGEDRFSPARRLTTGGGPDIHHRVAAEPDGGLCMVWQSDRGGQFDVLACRINDNEVSAPYVVSAASPRGDWHPTLAVTPDGTVFVAWDAHDGESYNVYARIRRGATWSPIVPIAQGPSFEGKASLAAGPDGRVWILWEEGARHWGRAFHQGLLPITEARGSLHRLRRLHLAQLESNGTLRYLETQLPMPSFDQAVARPKVPAGSERVGCFYERGQLAVDRRGRLWAVYRHFYVPEFLGFRNFDENDLGLMYGLFARYLDGRTWSRLYRFDVRQGDGHQRSEVIPDGDGIAAVWTTGRTHRNYRPLRPLKDNKEMSYLPRGLAWSRLRGSGQATAELEATVYPPTTSPTIAHAGPVEQPRTFSVAGKEYRLFYGDLHRHTDYSRCYHTSDGSIDDAYRYAIDAAELAFVGITDHASDLNWGNVAGQRWWIQCKQVSRHHLTRRFFPLHAYEHSRSFSTIGLFETDHNVISLRADMLRSELYTRKELYSEITGDTFLIPHAPINKYAGHNIWDSGVNDGKRPLLELYQGFRHRMTAETEEAALEGLNRGHRFGFISSSDHLSTSASYAAVWATEPGRESIFRALQARRTFAATARIRLIVLAGRHWMGEAFAASSMPDISIEARGTAPFKKIEIILDGEMVERFSADTRDVQLTYEPEDVPAGDHYLYVRLTQGDGNTAWSSPLFVRLGP